MSLKKNVSALFGSGVLVVVGTVIGTLSGLFQQIIFSRAFQPQLFGELNIALSVLFFASTVSLVGLSQAVPRYISRFDTEADSRGTWATAMLTSIPAALAVAGLVWVGADIITRTVFETPDATRLIRAIAPAIPCYAAYRIGIGAIRGMENTRYRVYVQNLLYPGVLLVGAGVVLLLNLSLVWAGVLYVVACLVAAVASHLLLSRLLPLFGSVRLRPQELFRFAAPLLFSAVLFTLLSRTDTLMLGYFTTSTQVGYYDAAYPIANGVVLPLAAIGYLYLPMVSRLDAAGKSGRIKTIYQLMTKWTAVVALPLASLLIVAPEVALRTLFGGQYVDGAGALTVLALGFLTHTVVGRNGQTVSAFGRTTVIMYANTVAFGLNIALNWFLIPPYGIVGAAVASASSYAGLNLCLSVYLFVSHDIHPLSGYNVRTLLAAGGLVVSSHLLVTRLALPAPVLFVLSLGVGGLAALLGVILGGGLQPEDRYLVQVLEERLGREIPVVRSYLEEPEQQ